MKGKQKKMAKDAQNPELTEVIPIELGKTYKDSVSGWVGVAVAKIEYVNGCVRYELAHKDKDGLPKAYVFDEEQIVEVNDAPVMATSSHGGPQDSTPIPRH